MARTAFDVVFGVGRRSFSVVPGPESTAADLMARVAAWPDVGTDQATGIVVRHRRGALSSSVWGSMAYHTFDRFRVARGGACDLIVEQTLTPVFRVLGFLLVAGSFAGAAVGCIDAVRGTPAALLALVGPIFFRLGYMEIGREKAAHDCRDFLLSGLHRQQTRSGQRR